MASIKIWMQFNMVEEIILVVEMMMDLEGNIILVSEHLHLGPVGYIEYIKEACSAQASEISIKNASCHVSPKNEQNTHIHVSSNVEYVNTNASDSFCVSSQPEKINSHVNN